MMLDYRTPYQPFRNIFLKGFIFMAVIICPFVLLNLIGWWIILIPAVGLIAYIALMVMALYQISQIWRGDA